MAEMSSVDLTPNGAKLDIHQDAGLVTTLQAKKPVGKIYITTLCLLLLLVLQALTYSQAGSGRREHQLVGAAANRESLVWKEDLPLLVTGTTCN